MAPPLSVGGAVLVYLVRHGAADGAAGRCVGRCDLPLSDAGRADVARLAAGWRAPRPPRVVTSDLRRAHHSAAALAAEWGARLDVDARLREMDFGAWDGRAWDDLAREDPARFAAWTAAWDEACTPDGEGFPQLVARVAGWVDAAVADARRAGVASVVAVAHAGSIRAALVHALGVPRAAAFRFRIDHARVSVLRVGAEGGAGCAAAGELLQLNADRPHPGAG